MLELTTIVPHPLFSPLLLLAVRHLYVGYWLRGKHLRPRTLRIKDIITKSITHLLNKFHLIVLIELNIFLFLFFLGDGVLLFVDEVLGLTSRFEILLQKVVFTVS